MMKQQNKEILKIVKTIKPNSQFNIGLLTDKGLVIDYNFQKNEAYCIPQGCNYNFKDITPISISLTPNPLALTLNIIQQLFLDIKLNNGITEIDIFEFNIDELDDLIKSINERIKVIQKRKQQKDKELRVIELQNLIALIERLAEY